MVYDTIIIGAGAGGLSCGLKLSESGKKVLILERQLIPGGCATTFTRSGFTFESSMHCVDGLAKDGELRKILEENGIDKKLEFIELKDFCRVVYPDYDFTVNFEQEHLLNFFREKFPEETPNLNKLVNNLDRFYKQFDRFSSSELPLFLQLIVSPFFYSEVIKVSSLTVNDFFNKYIKDPRLKSIITDLWKFLGLPPDRLSALYFLIVLRGYYLSKTCYVKGGYTRIFQEMARKIKENGSEIRYNTTVRKIITERKVVKGVMTDKGEELRAQTLVSNANAIETLGGLIDDLYVREKYAKELSAIEKSVSVFQVYLGLDVPAVKLGMRSFILSLNSTYNHQEAYSSSIESDYDRCLMELVDHVQLDPSLAPNGKGTLLIMTFDSYKNWEGISGDEYEARKKAAAGKLIKRSEKYLPGISDHIEIMEVATPKTMLRYTLAPEGAIYGFAHSVNQSGIFRLDQKTRIKRLFLAGAWTRPGAGIHGCFISGRDAAEYVLKTLCRFNSK